ncbi:MAG: hypothetical protein IJX93_07665 [Clostridia bacterium]|nr:hypothetical protein [Clostridia bacterium]
MNQNRVDFFLRKGKSEGYVSGTLRFVDVCDLFGFTWEGQITKEGKLLSAGQL